jgi:hypothetical protein
MDDGKALTSMTTFNALSDDFSEYFLRTRASSSRSFASDANPTTQPPEHILVMRSYQMNQLSQTIQSWKGVDIHAARRS